MSKNKCIPLRGEVHLWETKIHKEGGIQTKSKERKMKL